jgi:phosphatidylglycerol lysyltransferase
MLRVQIVKVVKLILPVILLIVIFFEGKKELKNIDPSTLLVELQSYSLMHIILMVVLGILAFSSLLFYDFLLIKLLNIRLPLLKIAKISWIANSFNNVLGFGGLAGASLRGMLYKRHSDVDGDQLMSSILWVTPLMLSGLSILAWLPILSLVPLEFIFEKHQWLRFGVWGMAAYIPLYLFYLLISKKKSSRIKNLLFILVISVIEWLSAAIVLWGIARLLGNHISFPVMLAIFVAGAIAGVISLVPGGLGSFDLMVIVGMANYGVEDNHIIVIVLFYRLFYYIVPFILGLVFASTEVVSHTRSVMANNKYYKQLRAILPIPEFLISNLSHLALALLVFMSGVLLLLSASLPGTLERITFAERLLSYPILNLSHQLSVTAGISLLLLSRSIFLKVKDAYILTYVILLAGALFTFSKGFDFEEALFLLGITGLLRLSKRHFYRIYSPLSWTAFMTMGALTIGSIITYVSIGYFDQPFERFRLPGKLKDLLIKQPNELVMTGTLGLILALLFNAIGFKMLAFKRKTREEENHLSIETFLENQTGNVLTHLAFLNDKKFFWSNDQQVFMMYAVISDKLVVLGDPIGSSKSYQQAMNELHSYADLRGLNPIFYQVNKEMLPFYHENGYQFFKLGEEAYIHLEEFTLSGKKRAGLRAVKNKFEREGYIFSVVYPPFQEPFLKELDIVSKDWLGYRKEKGFSLGFFDMSYIQKAPVAVLKSKENEIIAFATFMPTYDDNETFSIDLMRHRREIPNGTMDMIFLSLIEYAKEHQYKWFNLGMAPLSNVGNNNRAFLDERIASKIYQYGHRFYAFEGVRKYKEKFTSKWEPKYLAVRGRQSLPITMLQLALLIGRRKNKREQ